MRSFLTAWQNRDMEASKIEGLHSHGITNASQPQHPGINHTDRLREILDDVRTESFPQGRGINAVQMRWEQNDRRSVNPYIQRCITDVTGACWIALCYLEAQARAFSLTKQWQFDMSFKRIRTKDINEICFSRLHPGFGKSKKTNVLGMHY